MNTSKGHECVEPELTTLNREDLKAIALDLNDVKLEALQPESTLLELHDDDEHKAMYFIGGLAYEKIIKADKLRGHRVYPSTLKPERIPALSKLIQHIAHQLHFEKLSSNTVYATLRNAKGFTNWLENNTSSKQQAGFFNSFPVAQEVLGIYCNHLRHRHSHSGASGISKNTAYNYYRVAVFLIKGIHERTLTEIIGGLDVIKPVAKPHGTKSAPPDDVLFQISVIKHLAMSIADGLLGSKPLPHKIDLGPLGTTYATPGKNPILSESVKAGNSSDSVKSPRWDYETNEYILNLRKSFHDAAIFVKPNPELPIYSRLFDTASKCFFVYFSAMLATNKTSLDKVQVGKDISIVSSKKRGSYGKLTTLKGRAGNQEQEFLFERVALDALNRYIELRNWALGEKESPWLFLSFSGADVPTRSPEFKFKFFWNWYRKTLDPNAIDLNSRQLRLHKANAILDETGDALLGSTVLQNTPATFLRSYSKGSETKAAAEVASGIKHIIANSIEDSTRPIYSMGNCASPNQEPAVETPPPSQIDVDCKTPEGCLFCKHFAIHADKDDLWKLISFKYVAYQTSSRGGSISEISEVFIPVFQRIDALIEAACQVDPKAKDLVTRLNTDVQRERLSPYWHTQLDKWVNIGVIHD